MGGERRCGGENKRQADDKGDEWRGDVTYGVGKVDGYCLEGCW